MQAVLLSSKVDLRYETSLLHKPGRSSVGTPSKTGIHSWKHEHLAKYQSSRGDEGHHHPEFAVLRNALDTTELTVI